MILNVENEKYFFNNDVYNQSMVNDIKWMKLKAYFSV